MIEGRHLASIVVVWLVVLLAIVMSGCDLFNALPVARITATPLAGDSPLIVTFDGSDSSDADGKIVAWDWDFGDGSDLSGETVHHTYVVTDATTTFTVTLTVRDNVGATDREEQTIEVRPTPSEEGGGGTGTPVAVINVDRVAGATPLTVQFDAQESQAGAGTITAYNWEFGDGTTASGAVVSHKYEPATTREYTATLFVWNSEGALSSVQVRIVAIVPADVTGDEDPHAEFDTTDPLLLYDSPEPANVPTLYEVTFDPGGSYADAGHAIEYFIWDFGDGSDWLIETSDIQVTHVYALAAQSRTYVVRLFVYDDQGLENVAPANLTLAQPED
jgi:PKD repeat protein